MWIKKKSRLNIKGQSHKSKMGPLPTPLAEFEKVLHKATSAEDESALPNVAVVAADANGGCKYLLIS
jgi:hypothetical protein